MSRPITRGWITAIPSWLGRDGIRIREFGLAARISISESASESAGTAALAGAGAIGDSIGITDTQGITAAGTTPEAARFITGATTTEEQTGAAELTAVRAEFTPASTRGTGPGTWEHAVE